MLVSNARQIHTKRRDIGNKRLEKKRLKLFASKKHERKETIGESPFSRIKPPKDQSIYVDIYRAKSRLAKEEKGGKKNDVKKTE